MKYNWLLLLMFGLFIGNLFSEETMTRSTPKDRRSTDVFVIPIEGQISDPQLYILRRAVKEAIEKG